MNPLTVLADYVARTANDPEAHALACRTLIAEANARARYHRARCSQPECRRLVTGQTYAEGHRRQDLLQPAVSGDWRATVNDLNATSDRAEWLLQVDAEMQAEASEHAGLPLGLPLGLHASVPNALYHRPEIGVVSKSALDRVTRSPAHYREWLQHGGADTPAMAFGRAFHAALLEPDVYATDYAIQPDFGDCRRKDNKARRHEWREQNAGAQVISEDDALQIARMQAAVLSHPIASKLLQGGQSELTVTWQDEETGLCGKSRADYYLESRGVVVDVKTALDASVDEFAKSCARFRYHVQDALYRFAFANAGKPVEHFVLVAVEKESPHCVAVHTLDSEAIGKGYTAARQDMATLADAMKRDDWGGYPAHINTIELPRWA